MSKANAVGPGGRTGEEENLNEDAAELKFPKEFTGQGCDALMTSEVFLLLDHRREQSKQKEEIEEFSDVFTNTLQYTQRLSKFKSRETIRAVRALFTDKFFLDKYEIAQIANLCPESAEEAKALIPSLGSKLTDEELDEILTEISAKMSFQ